MAREGRWRKARARGLASLLVVALALGPLAAVSYASVTGPSAAETLGGNSFNELTQKAQESNTEAPPTSTTGGGQENGGPQPTNSGKTLVVVLAVAVVLLSVITFVIVRDARRVAPAGDADLIDSQPLGRTARQRNRRAKAKAARKQRKRNR